MEDIILIGGGGHCKSVIDSIRSKQEYNIAGILDLKERVGYRISDVKIIGTDDDLDNHYNRGIKNAFLTIGSIGDTDLRIQLYLHAINIGYNFPNIIDQSSLISSGVKIGCGNFIGKGAIINAGSKIKNNCIVNTGAIIEHDCEVESFCHIGPSVTMSGNVYIGESTHIGTNSTIIQNISIGNNSLIGAGSVVIESIGSYKKAYGNPCKVVGSHG